MITLSLILIGIVALALAAVFALMSVLPVYGGNNRDAGTTIIAALMLFVLGVGAIYAAGAMQ